MREYELLRKFNLAYKRLNLKLLKLVITAILMLCTSLLEMAGLSILYPLMLVMGGTVDQIGQFMPVSMSATGQLLVLFAMVAVLFVAKNIALYFTYNNNINFAVYFYRHLVRGIYQAYVNKNVLAFREESAGSLANIVCVQSGKLVDGALRPMLVVFTELFVLLGISLLLFYISPGLMVGIIIACGCSAALFYGLMRNKALSWGKKEMQASARLQELVSNTSGGISEIKIFNKEDFLTDRVYSAATDKTSMFHHLEMFQQGPRFILETVFIVTMLAFLAVSLMAGTPVPVLLAQFSIIAAASFRMLPSINRIINSYSNFSFNIGPALQVLDVVGNIQPHVIKYTVSSADEFKHFDVNTIELKNISFQYPGAEHATISDVNLLIQKGRRVGIMGASGSGKSTLIEILAGLYQQTDGEVLVDGHATTDAIKEWQSCIGYVPQMSFILPASLRDNICFSRQSADDDEIWRVLDQLKMTDFVMNLPKGLDTEVGEKGIALSGGQKQLICLARALYRQPKVLLLDEPTASLDAINEEIVLERIKQLPSDVTIVMVSHKQHNFADFDDIYVCENGKLTSSITANEKVLVG